MTLQDQPAHVIKSRTDCGDCGCGSHHPSAVPIPALAQFTAGTFVTILRWWLDHKMPYSPKEMDNMLHWFIQPGVQRCLQEEASTEH